MILNNCNLYLVFKFSCETATLYSLIWLNDSHLTFLNNFLDFQVSSWLQYNWYILGIQNPRRISDISSVYLCLRYISGISCSYVGYMSGISQYLRQISGFRYISGIFKAFLGLILEMSHYVETKNFEFSTNERWKVCHNAESIWQMFPHSAIYENSFNQWAYMLGVTWVHSFISFHWYFHSNK